MGACTQGIGRSRGGLSTKIHLIADAHGNPVNFLLSPGQMHESRHANSLLVGVEAQFVLGDRAFDGNAIREAIADMGAEAVIPPHPGRKNPPAYDRHLYKARHAIENLFAKLKQYRSLATRYDKTMRNYSAMVAIACMLTWLRL
jgi:transposase